MNMSLQDTHKPRIQLGSLSIDLLALMCSFLSLRDHRRAASVCSAFRKATDRPASMRVFDARELPGQRVLSALRWLNQPKLDSFSFNSVTMDFNNELAIDELATLHPDARNPLSLAHSERTTSLALVRAGIGFPYVEQLVQRFPNLTALDLHGNPMSSFSMSSLSALKQLKTLNIIGASPTVIGLATLPFATLRELKLSGSCATEEFANMLCSWPNLEVSFEGFVASWVEPKRLTLPQLSPSQQASFERGYEEAARLRGGLIDHMTKLVEVEVRKRLREKGYS